MFHSRLIFLCVGLIFLASCGPDENSITQTVASQVAGGVSATIAAQPTVTPYPTLTPVDTATPYPTYTPLATAVPADTATPYPTYTPYPTDTPEPTATTVPATNTPLPVATNAAPLPAATAPPAVDQQAQLLSAVESALHDIDVAKSSLWTVNPGNFVQRPTDCPTLVAAYDHLANGLVMNTTTSDVTTQNSYSLYRTAVDSALAVLQPRTDECRTFITAGASGTVMNQTEFNAVEDKLVQSQNWLNQALAALSQG